MKKSSAIILAIALAFSALTGCTTKVDNRVMSVMTVVNDVKIYREPNEEAIIAQPGNQLLHKDNIVVGEDSEAEIMIDSDKTIFLKENTEVIVAAVGLAETDRTELVLLEGAADIELNYVPTEENPFEVTTPNGILNVKGSYIEVEYNKADNYTYLYVDDGEVVVSYDNTDKQITIGAKEACQIIDNQLKTGEDICIPE